MEKLSPDGKVSKKNNKRVTLKVSQINPVAGSLTYFSLGCLNDAGDQEK